jgi:hypothetical protein
VGAVEESLFAFRFTPRIALWVADSTCLPQIGRDIEHQKKAPDRLPSFSFYVFFILDLERRNSATYPISFLPTVRARKTIARRPTMIAINRL